MECNCLTNKWSSLGKKKIHLNCSFYDVIHIKVFWSLPRNTNRTCIIHSHLHALIPIKRNWAGHVFKGSVDSDMLQGKAFWQSLTIRGFTGTYERMNEGHNMCTEYAEENVLINSQITFLSLNWFILVLGEGRLMHYKNCSHSPLFFLWSSLWQ